MKLSIVLAFFYCSCSFARDWVISPDGYGPVKIGMSLKQAESALNTKLIPDDEGPNDACYHVHPAHGHTELQFMIQANKVSRVRLYGGRSSIKTDKGVALGDSEKKVFRLYGDSLEIAPHAYGDYPEDKYLTYWTKDKQFGVRYETNHGVVETIHGGSTAIRYIEGCS